MMHLMPHLQFLLSSTFNHYLNSEFNHRNSSNRHADYAANSNVYQPESREAIFNSLEKHTLQDDFTLRHYITLAALKHGQYAEEAYVKVEDNR